MDVILLQKVANLGNIGDRVKVRSGYGRNYLLPTARATLATPDNIKKFEARRAELERLANEHLASAQTRAAAFKDFRLAITAKAGTEGKLFGSVTTGDIAQAIHAQANISIDRKKLHVEQIKTLGTYSVAVKLHSDVEFPVSVEVVKA